MKTKPVRKPNLFKLTDHVIIVGQTFGHDYQSKPMAHSEAIGKMAELERKFPMTNFWLRDAQ